MGSGGKKCTHDYKIRCMHSDEAVTMLLSHAPQRLSIKEISGITQFHRNTMRPTIYRLRDENVIHDMGSGNYTVYYLNTVTEHYRKIAKTLYELEENTLSSEERLVRLRKFGRDLVLNNLRDLIKTDTENFIHDNVVEALVHVKMSYPFNDIIYDEDGNVHPSVNFKILQDEGDTIDQTDFDLAISPCLCKGDENSYMCHMVAGALDGGIEVTCGVKADKVAFVDEKSEGKNYCVFNIQARFPEHQTKEIDDVDSIESQLAHIKKA